MSVNPAQPIPASNLAQQAADLLKSAELLPEYPNVFPMNFAGGKFYIDSTPNKENVYIRHKSGSFIYFETNGDIFIHSPRDLKVCAERHMIMKVGEGDKDKCVVHVTGDAHLKVEKDLNVEIGGDKNETISGNYNLNVKGVYSSAANNRNTKTTGKHTEISHEIENNVTFVKNNIGTPGKGGVGGEIRDIIFGNRVVEMVDPRSTYTIRSTGFMEFNAAINIRQVAGANFTSIVGAEYSQTVGGSMSTRVGATLQFNTGGVTNITSGGILRLSAPQIFLN